MKEYGDKLSADNKEGIESALGELRTAHQSQDAASIDTAMERLNTAWQAASQEMYAAGPEAGAPASDGQSANNATSDNGSEDVTDVNFEEVK